VAEVECNNALMRIRADISCLGHFIVAEMLLRMSSCRMGHRQKVCETAVHRTTNEIEVVGKSKMDTKSRENGTAKNKSNKMFPRAPMDTDSSETTERQSRRRKRLDLLTRVSPLPLPPLPSPLNRTNAISSSTLVHHFACSMSQSSPSPADTISFLAKERCHDFIVLSTDERKIVRNVLGTSRLRSCSHH
jgi:hypothetical protein